MLNKNIGKNLFLILLFFLLIGLANAVSFTDSFSTYSSNYKIISNTELSDITSFDIDTNQPTTKSLQANGFSLNWLDGNNFYVPVDVSLNASHTSRVIIKLDQNFNLADFNSNGIMHMPFWFDANAGGSGIRIDIRLGSGTGNYFEYRKSFTEETSWWLGRHDLTYDLNNASVTVGSPTFSDMNMAWVIINHTASAGDYNWSINNIWVEKNANGFSGGNWEIEKPNVNAQGMAIIDNNKLVLNNIDRQSYGYHGRIFSNAFDSVDLSKENLILISDINVIDSNWGARLMWDYIDGNDFSSCFIFYSTPTSVRYGIEQWINNIRSFTQVTATSSYGVNKNIKCTVSGVENKTAKMYVNSVEVVSYDLVSRQDGAVGFETFSNCNQCNGKIRIDNVSFTSTTPMGNTSNIYQIILEILIPAILLLVFLSYIQSGNLSITEIGSVGIGLIIFWLILRALLFGA